MGQDNKIQLSVALVTMNRPESLNRALQSLRAQSCQPCEIIVSDDSNSSQQEASKEISKLWECRYIVGPRRGLYANRNHSAIACSGTHVRTMDDDHFLPPGHLQTCLSALESDPNAVWTTGERGFVDGKYYMTLETATQLHPAGVGQPVSNIDDNWSIADGSTIYPMKVFAQGHRMVDWYSYGPSYLEFGAYLYKHGFKSRCIPGALVDHYAEQVTLGRLNSGEKELQSIESQLFASLCFNLHFKPNKLLCIKYLASCLTEAKFSPQLVHRLPQIVARVNERWRKSSSD